MDIYLAGNPTVSRQKYIVEDGGGFSYESPSTTWRQVFSLLGVRLWVRDHVIEKDPSLDELIQNIQDN